MLTTDKLNKKSLHFESVSNSFDDSKSFYFSFTFRFDVLFFRLFFQLLTSGSLTSENIISFLIEFSSWFSWFCVVFVPIDANQELLTHVLKNLFFLMAFIIYIAYRFDRQNDITVRRTEMHSTIYQFNRNIFSNVIYDVKISLVRFCCCRGRVSLSNLFGRHFQRRTTDNVKLMLQLVCLFSDNFNYDFEDCKRLCKQCNE